MRSLTLRLTSTLQTNEQEILHAFDLDRATVAANQALAQSQVLKKAALEVK